MEQVSNDAVEIDVKEILFVLLHKIWIVILIGVLGAAGAWSYSTYLIQPIYTSTTSVYVINRQEETNLTLSDLQTGEQLTKDYMILVKSRPVTEQVIRKLDLTMSSDALASLIQVNTPEDTRILEIRVNHNDPATAKRLADAIAEVSAERMVSVMGVEKVNVMEEGNLPQSPSSPDVMKKTILGGFLGAALVCGIVVLIYMMNDNIKTTDDVEKYLGITSLGMLPLEEGNQGKKHKKGKKNNKDKKDKKDKKEPKEKRSRKNKKAA